MDERYKQFNEMTFEAYCKKSIDRAVNRGRKQKSQRARDEISLFALSEEVLARSCEQLDAITDGKQTPTIFRVGGLEIIIHDEELAAALQSLTPQRRNIVLLAYFMGKSDAEISRDMKLTRSAVQRRRTNALDIMKRLMGGTK